MRRERAEIFRFGFAFKCSLALTWKCHTSRCTYLCPPHRSLSLCTVCHRFHSHERVVKWFMTWDTPPPPSASRSTVWDIRAEFHLFALFALCSLRTKIELCVARAKKSVEVVAWRKQSEMKMEWVNEFHFSCSARAKQFDITCEKLGGWLSLSLSTASKILAT